MAESKFDRAALLRNRQQVTGEQQTIGNRKTVAEMSKEQVKLDEHCYYPLEFLKINYAKTFGDLIYLGLNNQRNHINDDGSVGVVRDRSYQVFSTTHQIDFNVRLKFEDVEEILNLPVGAEIELIEPVAEPFAVIQTDGRTINKGFSFKAKAIRLKGGQANVQNDFQSEVKSQDHNHSSKQDKK